MKAREKSGDKRSVVHQGVRNDLSKTPMIISMLLPIFLAFFAFTSAQKESLSSISVLLPYDSNVKYELVANGCYKWFVTFQVGFFDSYLFFLGELELLSSKFMQLMSVDPRFKYFIPHHNQKNLAIKEDNLLGLKDMYEQCLEDKLTHSFRKKLLHFVGSDVKYSSIT